MSSTFSWNHSLNAIGEALCVFFDSVPQPCNLKHAKTKRYYMTSQSFAALFGVSRAAIIGHTARDLVINRLPLEINANRQWINKIEALDAKVCATKELVVANKMVFIDYLGFIQIATLIKFPVLNQRSQMVAIMSYSEDLTDQYALDSLLQLYRHYYPIQEAIEHFLRYLGLLKYFSTVPTYKEILLLLALHFKDQCQQIFQASKVTKHQIDYNTKKLFSKINGSIAWESILKRMASYHGTMK